MTSNRVLEQNLAALAVRSPATAALVRVTPPMPGLVWTETPEGPSARLGEGGPLLCSAHRPRDEARALVDTIDLEHAGGVAVLGMGVGHHVVELARRLGRHAGIFVFEPQVGLLRAVLERVDLSGPLAATHCVVLTDAQDEGAISAAMRGVEGLLALGVKILEHPASRARLGPDGAAFGERFTSVMRTVKTHVVTTLMNCEVTLRNELGNLDRYGLAPGIEPLRGAAAGRPAIVVSAGPSLARSLETLARPEVRERFVIVAVQTALRTLLARGIRPHFVTALDYHELSRRFYDGLRPDDVAGVTLVAEAKANPAILEAFPGAVRFPRDETLDRLLGPALAREMGAIAPGATVAHLAYYLARHLGCDPVILVGQDLGFTDGLYYGPGAAIHHVWGAELSPFNTLEMLEWQRIARGRPQLQRAADAQGRPLYTDEQMATYRVQFERDFAADAQAGRTTIDATGGGVAKRHARAMDLEAAIERFDPGTPWMPPACATGGPAADTPAQRAIVERAREVRQSVWRIGRHCAETADLLRDMLARHGDQARVNALIGKVDAVRDRVAREEPAFTLVQLLNQTGTLKRVRADRALALAKDLTPIERQRRQIERDIENVTWLGDAAEQLGAMLDAAIRGMEGGPRGVAATAPARTLDEEGAPVASRRTTVAAIVVLDAARGGLGTPRALDEPFLAGRTPVQLLLARLARCREIDRLVVLTDEPGVAAQLVGAARGPGGRAIEIVQAQGPLDARRAAVGPGRAWSRTCWRGGVSNLSVFDEAFEPGPTLAAMESLGIDAALPIGADWCLLDPALVDATIRRHRERPPTEGAPRLTFTHAAPGLGVAVLERSLVRDLHARAEQAGVLATIGGLLGYMPVMPMADPIAKPHCEVPPAAVRDAAARFIPDTARDRDALRAALSPLGEGVVAAGAEEIVRRVAASAGVLRPAGPTELVLELCTGRLTSGLRQQWLVAGAGRGQADVIERPPMPMSLAARVLSQLAERRPDAVVTLAGAGDPLVHPEVAGVVRLARRVGLAGVHVRTDLLAPPEAIDALLESGVDVISVDLMAETDETYRRVMGCDGLSRARDGLMRLLERRALRARAGGIPTPHVVPRITRCDATYAEIEPFYDRWIMLAGAAAIDPLPHAHAATPGERFAPLPLPPAAHALWARERMVVLCDGRVPMDEHDLIAERPLGDLAHEDLSEVYRRWCRRRAARAAGEAHQGSAEAPIAAVA